MAKKVIPLESLKKGEEGVEFLREHCVLNALSFKEATIEEDLHLGIDCYVEGKGTDVKNTPDLYFLQVYVESGQINVRHPFKITTKAEQLAQIKVNKQGEKEVLVSNIKELLSSDYCKSEEHYNRLLEYLQSMERQHWNCKGHVSLAQFLFKIKDYVSSAFLKENVKIMYQGPGDGVEECSMRMVLGKELKEGAVQKEKLFKGQKPLKAEVIKIIID